MPLVPHHPLADRSSAEEMLAFDRLCDIDIRFKEMIQVTGFSTRQVLAAFAQLRQSDYSEKQAADRLISQINDVMIQRRVDRVRPRVVR